MKQIALLTTLGLALFATAAFAHQYRGQHNGGFGHVQQSSSWGTGCPMNTGMNRGGMMHGSWGMKNHNGTHRGMYTTTKPGTYTNWRSNPAYQGQAAPNDSVE